MIINESKRNNDYEELEIKNPQKFIAAIGGITGSGLKESEDSWEELLKKESDITAKEIEQILNKNKMSIPPTVQEIKRSGNKIKVPWFLVGTLLGRAQTYGLEKKFRERKIK